VQSCQDGFDLGAFLFEAVASRQLDVQRQNACAHLDIGARCFRFHGKMLDSMNNIISNIDKICRYYNRQVFIKVLCWRK